MTIRSISGAEASDSRAPEEVLPRPRGPRSSGAALHPTTPGYSPLLARTQEASKTCLSRGSDLRLVIKSRLTEQCAIANGPNRVIVDHHRSISTASLGKEQADGLRVCCDGVPILSEQADSVLLPKFDPCSAMRKMGACNTTRVYRRPVSSDPHNPDPAEWAVKAPIILRSRNRRITTEPPNGASVIPLKDVGRSGFIGIGNSHSQYDHSEQTQTTQRHNTSPRELSPQEANAGPIGSLRSILYGLSAVPVVVLVGAPPVRLRRLDHKGQGER